MALRPADERLAGLYDQSCRTCHAVAVAGAPRTGDRAAWDVRWQKGLPTLVANTVNGFNAMPPRGQCFSCSPADYEALIVFMSARDATAE
jgi:cytochrome c5